MSKKIISVCAVVGLLLAALPVTPAMALQTTPTVTPTLAELMYLNPLLTNQTLSYTGTYDHKVTNLLPESKTICNGGDRPWGIAIDGDITFARINGNVDGSVHLYANFTGETGNFDFYDGGGTNTWTSGTVKRILGLTGSSAPNHWQVNIGGVNYAADITIYELFHDLYTDQISNFTIWQQSTGPGGLFWYDNHISETVTAINLDTAWLDFAWANGNIYGLCYGSHAPSGETQNLLGDGDMEQQPISNFWFESYDGLGTGKFGRISDWNLLTVGYGDPRCGSGWQVIGNTNACAAIPFPFYADYCAQNFSSIHQRFIWPGGKVFWRFSARGMPESGTARDVPINVYLKNTQSQEITLLYSGGVPETWTDYSGTVANLPLSTFWLEAALGNGHAQYDAFSLDDVVVSPGPIDFACSPVIPATTATAPAQTPTTSPTPSTPGRNIIDNCGFEKGEAFWSWQYQKSFVIYTAGNNYSHANYDSPNPGVSQAFYWQGGTIYLKFQSHGDYNVYFKNVITSQTYDGSTGTQPYSGWITHQAAISLPQGSYRLMLHHPAGSAYSEYDNLSLSEGGYGDCSAGTNVTPTAPATATSTAIATMYPTRTQGPTSTTLPGTPTATRIPSFTPYPTYTPKPTTQSTNTPRPNATNTPYPTYTSQPTFTSQPTYTPNAQGTIEPSVTPSATPPIQPPPSYYADCNRPTNGDVGWWLEYEKCQMLSYFDMSPNAVATYAAIPTAFGGREPFGTIDEVGQTNKDMKNLVDSYDWNNTGLPGTKDSINLDQYLTPTGPLITGHFDFSNNPGPQYSQSCEAGLANLVGPYLAGGVCFVLNIMRTLGIIPWMQLLVNLTAIGFLALYIWKKWIDAGSGG